MKVVLIGAPGSDKSVVAKRLKLNLNRDPDDLKWAIVDHVVEDLERVTGREYGPNASAPHNVQVMAHRWTHEARLAHAGYSTITAGSIYETILWSAIPYLVPPPAGEADLAQFMREAQTGMQFMGMMEYMTFNYDALFFLPLDAEKAAVHSWPAVINEKLPEAIAGYQRYAIPLEGTLRQKVSHALEVIRYLRDASAPPEDDGPAV